MNWPAPPTRAQLFDLLSTLSFERRAVVLASGAESNLYVDCKQTALHPTGALALGAHLLDVVEAIEAATGRTAAGVGGMSIGADPLSTAVSLTALSRGRHLPAFMVRKEPKGHGTEVYVEGRANLPDGSPVILLEDVITTGGSTIRAGERARREGLDPFGVAVIVDRQCGGKENLTAAGFFTESIFTLEQFDKGAL